eukprot:GFUD01069670.1.p1 GENE.GFUD01069670.1~~GFUD01069670.1.p1  ORF type:complete len:461 (-),score=86.00 GFUD01069670.1:212-1594(-)
MHMTKQHNSSAFTIRHTKFQFSQQQLLKIKTLLTQSREVGLGGLFHLKMWLMDQLMMIIRFFSDFNRGHLFPWAYAKNADQARTTMRLTNCVPQDQVFNQYQWRLSETKLKKNYIDECNKVSTNKAIVVTGSVAQYFGENPKKDHKNMKIGKTDKNQRFYDLSPNTKIDLVESDEEMKNKITVPTHMWTYYLCVSETFEVLDQVSYIGLNYRTGVIKWYTNLDKFLSTLTKMYDKQNVQFIPLYPLHAFTEAAIKSWKSSLNVAVEMEKMDKKTCFGTQGLKVKTMQCNEDPVAEKQFWDNVNVFNIRKLNEKSRLNYLMRFYGTNFVYSDVQLNAARPVTETVEKVEKTQKISEEKKRKKRSTVNTDKVIQKAIQIMDNDPNSDFIIKECSILETYINGTLREEHVFNFENNILIQDKNVNSGSNLNATTFIDGKVTEAKKEVSKKREINIILQKRDGL